MLYAASLPKIAILLGAFVQIERGKLVLDDNLRQEMTRMIRKSSNKAATSVLNRVGIAEHAEGGEGLSELVGLVDDLMNKMQ